MIKSLLLYSVYRYGSISTRIITDMFVDEFPYMSGCNLAVLIPEGFHHMRVGDVFFVKRDSGYGSEWDGWPMVVESMESNRVTMRYQKRSDGEHNTITYDLNSLHEHLESL